MVSLKNSLLGLFLFMALNVMTSNVSAEGQAVPSIDPNAPPIKIVVTFSVLSDLVKQVGKQNVQVYSLIGMDENAHMFRPSPQDVQKVEKANLFVVNGLGFEGWLDRLVLSAQYKGNLLTASEGVDAISLVHGGHQGGGHVESSIYDPHAWHSIRAVKVYIKNIARALQVVDAKNQAYYQQNMNAYLSRLKAFEKIVNRRMASIPEGRHIVVPHNAIAYLARDYGLHIHSLQGLSAEAETSAAQIAKVIRQVRKYNIKAIFSENISDERLIKLVQYETGVNIGGALITGALSRKLAPSYLDMMAYNIDLIIKALTPPR